MNNSVIVLVLSAAALCASSSAAENAAPTSIAAASQNEEVARLFAEDQSDRQPKEGKPIDWAFVGPRDKARLKRVRQLYTAGELKTGKDYYHAAMILQHGEQPEDYLLCHELCVAAVFKSARSERANLLSDSKWLAAASYDRFLLSIGRRQRFGTQFSSSGPRSPSRLDKMEEGVTDELRKVWSVPSLAEAKKREAEMNATKK